MTRESRIRLLTPGDVTTWVQSEDREIYLGDVVDASNSDTMGVGFARYAPGEANRWIVTYDEALVVTRGAFSVTAADGRKTTAGPGEVIFLTRNTELVYAAEESGAELVYVMYPHWADTQLASEHADLLETFRPASGTPPRFGDGAASRNLALMRAIWGPLERGESSDFGPFFDALSEEVVFITSAGEVRGRQALIAYFAEAATAIQFNPFLRPLQYYVEGDRVVILGNESFAVMGTGATHRAEWAWVIDMRDDRIERILSIQDLSPIADVVGDQLTKAQLVTT